MAEIVNVQIGQCGNQIGEEFWKKVCEEHYISPDGSVSTVLDEFDSRNDKLNVYFNEGKTSNKWVPRSVLVDLEPGVLNRIRGGELKDFFNPENFVYGNNGAGNNWAKGHRTEGADLIDKVMERVRKETEQQEKLHGFQVSHSLGGGTGSGMGTLLLGKLRDDYSDKMVNSFSVFPSPKSSDVVVEPYNTMFSIRELLHNTDQTVCLDNEALHQIAKQVFGKDKTIKFAELNELTSRVMAGVTASHRFPGQLNSNLRKTGVNLIPHEYLHFLIPTHVPLFSHRTSMYNALTIDQLGQHMFDDKNLMMSCGFGRIFTAAAMFRGAKISMGDVEESMKKLQAYHKEKFVPWIPNNFKTAACNVPQQGYETSATVLINTTALMDPLKQLRERFDKMFNRNAFLHWYTEEGMDTDDFKTCQDELNDLISMYEEHADFKNDDTDEWSLDGEEAVCNVAYETVAPVQEPDNDLMYFSNESLSVPDRD